MEVEGHYRDSKGFYCLKIEVQRDRVTPFTIFIFGYHLIRKVTKKAGIQLCAQCSKAASFRDELAHFTNY